MLKLRTNGVWYIQNAGKIFLGERDNTRAFRGAPAGAGDIVGIMSGIHVEVEVKVTAEHKDHQKKWGKLLTEAGGIYLLVRYQPRLSPAKNVERAVRMVDEAITERVV
jgi:hypothetical protein